MENISLLFNFQLVAECDPERMIPIPESDHHVRLIDHAFSQICNAVNDISVRVRTQAVSSLGSMTGVSEYFLQQTCDKKLMSNMKVTYLFTYLYIFLHVTLT